MFVSDTLGMLLSSYDDYEAVYDNIEAVLLPILQESKSDESMIRTALATFGSNTASILS